MAHWAIISWAGQPVSCSRRTAIRATSVRRVSRFSMWRSVDEGAGIAGGERDGPAEQAQMVVGPELDGGQAEAVDLHELTQPRPRRVIQAQQVAAVRLVPGEFLPRIRRAADGFIDVVVDARILVALDQERVEAGTRTRCPLRRQVDVAQQPARVRV